MTEVNALMHIDLLEYYFSASDEQLLLTSSDSCWTIEKTRFAQRKTQLFLEENFVPMMGESLRNIKLENPLDGYGFYSQENNLFIFYSSYCVEKYNRYYELQVALNTSWLRNTIQNNSSLWIFNEANVYMIGCIYRPAVGSLTLTLFEKEEKVALQKCKILRSIFKHLYEEEPQSSEDRSRSKNMEIILNFVNNFIM